VQKSMSSWSRAKMCQTKIPCVTFVREHKWKLVASACFAAAAATLIVSGPVSQVRLTGPCTVITRPDMRPWYLQYW
jgi:hypothetical protein